jgi:hemolysin D
MKSTNKGSLFTGRPGKRDAYERAFLPAALEIVETPPSPIGRAIGATIIAIFCLALLWAWFSTVDIIATAPGKIIPSGRVKVIQPLETGVIRAIHVHDGQRVKAGDVLIELDPAINEAERSHFQDDLLAAELEVARLRAALSDAPDPMSEFHPPGRASAELIATHRQFLRQQTEEHRAKIAALDHQKAQKEAERATIGATIEKIGAVIPLVQERFDIRKSLRETQLTSRITYLETLQSLVEYQNELLVQKNHYREADAAVAAITESRAEAAAEYHRTRFSELTEAERKATGFRNDLLKLEERTKFQQLTAPEDGVVQQLAVHTLRGVVTPAQALLVIVPIDSHLEIEAMVSNRDVGFVRAGQDAEIKIDTFNFTRYGLIHGKVVHVSPDAISREKGPEKPSNGTVKSDDTSEPKGQELVYAARIALAKTQMQVEDNVVNLTPGMAVKVEIKTGSRAVLNYVLSPLRRYAQESLRER